MKLTPKQQEMIDYIRDYIKKNGIAPNAAEAGEHFEKSRQTCMDMFKRLNEIGAIEYNKLGVRRLRIVGDDMDPVPVNLLSPVVDVANEAKENKTLKLSDTEAPDIAFRSKWLCMPLRAL